MAEQIKNYRFNKIQPKSDIIQFKKKNENSMNTSLVNSPIDESKNDLNQVNIKSIKVEKIKNLN